MRAERLMINGTLSAVTTIFMNNSFSTVLSQSNGLALMAFKLTEFTSVGHHFVWLCNDKAPVQLFHILGRA